MNIDLHFHRTPRFFLDELRDANPWGKTLHGSGDALSVRIGSIEIPISPEHWDIGRTLEVALPLHRRVNDLMAGIGRARPDRFAPLGTVPLQEPDAALRELERCMEIGLAGIEIETHANGRNLDDPSLRSFFAAAAELGAVVFLHPLAVLGAERLARHYLTNLIGNPTDTAVAVASLICGGVLEDLPDLKIVCAHGGGSTRMLCGRTLDGTARTGRRERAFVLAQGVRHGRGCPIIAHYVKSGRYAA